MSDDGFTRLCRSLDFPMAIVTAFDGSERSGCLVGFHTQCSIHPRRWLACISKLNHTFGVAQRTDRLAVHFLRNDQHALAELFGGITGDAIAPHEKFEFWGWRPGPGGTPILAGCDWIAGPVLERVDGGDHSMFLIEITDHGEDHEPAPQLGSKSVRDIDPGHPA